MINYFFKKRAGRGRLLPNRRRKRKPGRILLRSGILLLAAAAVVWGWNGLTDLEFFRVREVRLSGLRILQEDHVRPAAEAAFKGKSILDAGLGVLSASLGSDPWVSDIRLKRRFPDVLELLISEKEPAFYLREGARYFIADREGNPIRREISSRGVRVEVRGINPERWERGETREQRQAARAVEFIRLAKQPNFLVFPDSLEVVEAITEDDFTVVIGGTPFLFRYPFSARPWHRFLSVKEDILSRNPFIEKIDLRFPDKVIVRTQREKV